MRSWIIVDEFLGGLGLGCGFDPGGPGYILALEPPPLLDIRIRMCWSSSCGYCGGAVSGRQ
jgi:hypothetical protein